MQQNEKTTKNVTFRFDEGDFQVQLTFEPKNGKLIAPPSSISFLEFLKSLHLVEPSADANTWFNTCDGLTITCFSHPEYSFKIRKKADRLCLTVIPGKSFQEKRERDCKAGIQKQEKREIDFKVAFQKEQAAIN